MISLTSLFLLIPSKCGPEIHDRPASDREEMTMRKDFSEGLISRAPDRVVLPLFESFETTPSLHLYESDITYFRRMKAS